MPADFEQIRESLKNGSGAHIVNAEIGPANDFEFCMALDRFDFVLRRKMVSNESYVELEAVR